MKKILKASLGCSVQIFWCVSLLASWLFCAKELHEPSSHHQLVLAVIVLLQAIHVIFWKRVTVLTNDWIGKPVNNTNQEIKIYFSSKEIEFIFLSNQHLLPETIKAAIADGYHVEFSVEAKACRTEKTLSYRDKTPPTNAVEN